MAKVFREAPEVRESELIGNFDRQVGDLQNLSLICYVSLFVLADLRNTKYAVPEDISDLCVRTFDLVLSANLTNGCGKKTGEERNLYRDIFIFSLTKCIGETFVLLGLFITDLTPG